MKNGFYAGKHVLPLVPEQLYVSTAHICMLIVEGAGLEPHSALPTALPVIFNPYSTKLPNALQTCYGGATSPVRALFHYPIVHVQIRMVRSHVRCKLCHLISMRCMRQCSC